MLEIADIRYKEKYVEILLSSEELIKLPLNVFSQYRLGKGTAVDTILYQQLKEEGEKYSCRQKALGYLAMRGRSSLEMDRYLSRKGFSQKVYRDEVEYLKSAGLIDDYAFTLNYIRSRRSCKVIGDNLLKRELIQRGISSRMVDRALRERENDSPDFKRIYDLAYRKWKGLNHDKPRLQKITFYLRQRGFDGKTIRRVQQRLRKEGETDAPLEEDV